MTERRILLTGASGFIGAKTAERLRDRRYHLALLLRTPREGDRAAALYGDCDIIVGDLSMPASYRAALNTFRPDTLVHAAWHGVAGAERNMLHQVENIVETTHLLEEALAAGIKHFVGLGSQAEYGPHNMRLNETASTEPTTLYGACKLAAFHLTRTMCAVAGVRHAWLRIFSTYGPHDNPKWLIPYLIEKLRAGDTPDLTSCEQKWDFLFVDDAADAVVAVVDSNAAQGAFNLGAGEAPPLRDTITLLRDLVAPGVPLGIGRIPYRPDQIMHLEADTTRLRTVTGWIPQVNLRTGLGRTIEAHIDDRGR